MLTAKTREARLYGDADVVAIESKERAIANNVFLGRGVISIKGLLNSSTRDKISKI